METLPVKVPRARRQSAEPENLIDIRQILLALRRRIWPALATFAAVLAIAAILYWIAPRTFTATATVALDRRVAEIVSTGNEPALATDSPSVDTAVKILTSPALAERVVERLRLADRPGFGVPEDGKAGNAQQRINRAVNRVLSGLSVKRQGTSYAIDVQFTADDPELAAAVANATVEAYVSGNRNTKVDENARQVQILRNRLAKLREEVIRADAAVADYRSATNLVDVTGTSTQQEIATLDTQLAQARAEEASARARIAALGSTGADAGSQALDSPTLRDLRVRQAELTARRAELSRIYGEGYPPLASLNAQIADVNASIEKELARVRANAAVEAQIASGRTASVSQSRGAAQGTLMAGNKASVRLNDLQRTAESARSLYQSLLDRYRQLVAIQGAEDSGAYIIAHARPPAQPTSPSRLLFGVGGVVAALLATGAVVFLLSLFDRGFQSRAQVEETLGLPVVAMVPDLRTVPHAGYRDTGHMAPARFLIEHEGSVFNEAFRLIRTALHLQDSGRPVRSLAITSALPEEGKTTIAICLALSAAMAGMRVLLMDCDMRRRASSRSMGASVDAGLIEVLKGEAALEDAIIVDGFTKVAVLAQRPVAKADYDLIVSSNMRALIERAETMYDLVVLDTAPVLPLADARAVSAMAEGTLFVARWENTPIPAAELALDLLARFHANPLGVVLSLVNLKRQVRAGSHDEMVYYNRFKHYYT